jgi:hypothetical protein
MIYLLFFLTFCSISTGDKNLDITIVEECLKTIILNNKLFSKKKKCHQIDNTNFIMENIQKINSNQTNKQIIMCTDCEINYTLKNFPDEYKYNKKEKKKFCWEKIFKCKKRKKINI